MSTFSARVARESDGDITLHTETVDDDFLPEGGVRIDVTHSSVNYKDALAITPKGGVVRNYPIVPGIDLAGTVASSDDPSFSPGDPVLLHGYETGVSRHGGYAERAAGPADQIVPLGDGLSPAEAATIGTAGFTAAMSVAALVDRGLRPEDGKVLVTGASGGVGIVAVDLLAGLGYEVVASSGKEHARDLLSELGAAEVIGRVPEDPDAKIKPLGSETWAAAVDCVGGPTLAWVLSTIRYGGAVAASGLTGGAGLPTTVMPFILRGVALLGIDSVQAPIDTRRALWARLADDLRPPHLDRITTEVAVGDVDSALAEITRGERIGRTLVRVAGGL